MRATATPPDVKQMLPQYLVGGKHKALVQAAGGAMPEGRYLHWDQLRHREPPGGLTREEWWLGIKLARAPSYRYLPLLSRDEGAFMVANLPSLQALLDRFSAETAGEDAVARRGLTEEERQDALMDEAVHSAQMDGAAIGLEAARELLRSERAPVNRHERIVVDTWEGLLHVLEIAGEPLTPELFTELHQVMTRHSLEHGEPGRLRQPHEDPLVHTLRGESLFDPPLADELTERLPVLCAFANGESPDWPMHPVLRAILLHLWVGYEHPFVDANGRIARALTLWALLSQGYPLFQYLSLSRIFRRERSAYERAFLYATSDGFDATYFVSFVMEAVAEALEALESGVRPVAPPDPGLTPMAVEPRVKHPQATLLEHAMAVSGSLNERQLSLVRRALRAPDEVVTIKTYQERHHVAYGTARSDLQDLFARGLVVRRRAGKSWEFQPVREAVDRLFG